MSRSFSFLEVRPRVDIDLDALVDNYGFLRGVAPGAEAAAVVKCDGYGLGAVKVAQTLYERAGCKSFFVAYAEEGAIVRDALSAACPDATIYVFNGPGGDLNLFSQKALTPILNSLKQAEYWAHHRPGQPAALHIDTGMNRLGAPLSEIDAITRLDHLRIDVVMSHLACGSEPANAMNERQHSAFIASATPFPQARKSLAASGGTLIGQDYHFDLLRLGVALYGASPFDAPHDGLKPVARLTAPVIQMREAPAGSTAGYGATHRLKRRSTLATVALGYGDGYLRAASNRGVAYVNGSRIPIIGRVSMDLIILDVTETSKSVTIGDRAEFFGSNLPIEDAAAASDTIAYELLTGLRGRIERSYFCAGQ